ncbi:hypothetical protein WAF17_22025 [Bernardetia sp. ABR2-2B]|uniref:hypothetical protein n=1 Tax=Bernardetia sp. ABR2-2B TaxID=3127472 RepID=UPI0030D61E23
MEKILDREDKVKSQNGWATVLIINSVCIALCGLMTYFGNFELVKEFWIDLFILLALNISMTFLSIFFYKKHWLKWFIVSIFFITLGLLFGLNIYMTANIW